MSIEAGYGENRQLADMLVNFGITGPDHSALKDRESLGRYLVDREPPEGPRPAISITDWREQRRALSHAGVEQLREAARVCLTPAPGATPPVATGSIPPTPATGTRTPTAQVPTPEARIPTPEARLPTPPPTPRAGEPAGVAVSGGEEIPTDREEEAPPIVSDSIHSPPGEGSPSDEPAGVGLKEGQEAVEETAEGEESVGDPFRGAPEEALAEARAKASPEMVDVIVHMEDLVRHSRFVEAFRAGVAVLDERCEEPLVDACVSVSRMASLWDRDKRIAPYALFDDFDALAAAFGKHVREMRHIDPDPLRATSGLYRLATKIFSAWVDHCKAVLEHQHRRTNVSWIQTEWIQPHRFNCLLAIMRSAVRIKLPLDLLFKVYQSLRQAIAIGKAAIAFDVRKVKFEGDCLRILASPSKDVIPDLCYIIFRDIIDVYVEAGENASAMMFCDQALLLRRGDREVEQIKAEIIAKSGHKSGLVARPSYHHQRAPFH